MAIRFWDSALRHRISRDQVRFVIDHCGSPLYGTAPGDEDLVVFLGPDRHGVPLEIVGIELADGDLLVIHAMKLRDRYRADYSRVMRCHER